MRNRLHNDNAAIAIHSISGHVNVPFPAATSYRIPNGDHRIRLLLFSCRSFSGDFAKIQSDPRTRDCMTPAFSAILTPDNSFLTGPSKYPSLAISSNRPSRVSLGDNHPWTREYLRNCRSAATYPSLVPGSHLPQGTDA